MHLVLGLESSCDETAASVVRDGREILSNIVRSQDELHAPWGGVVPEVASRAHLEALLPVIQTAVDEAGVTLEEIDGIAVTHSPGLVGALLVALSGAKALSVALDLPLVGVQHIHAHIYAGLMQLESPEYPAVSLVVSGGHTSLYRTEGPADHQLLGTTRDDAAGECFDKVAKILGLGYPGGPLIDKLATDGDPKAFALPRSSLDGFDFSFSGLKTAVLYTIHPPQKGSAPRPSSEPLPEEWQNRLPDLAASFQDAVVDALVKQTRQAIKETGARTLVIGGGVACNRQLRRRIEALAEDCGCALAIPPVRLCTDNAAMIAGLGWHRLAAGERDELSLDAVPTSR